MAIDSASMQLERLLDMADMTLLRMLELAVFPSGVRRYSSRIVEVHRRELLLMLKREDLVSDALRYLVVENNEEFIPRSLWQLNKLVGVGDEVLNHKHFLAGQRFVSQTFSPGTATICLFLPCHRVKPYCFSPTIQVVKSALESRNLLEHVVMAVASVPGIVPIGFDRYYPFAYYNWDPMRETTAMIRTYSEVLRVRAREFIKSTKGSFSHFVAYFRPQSIELEALVGAARDEGVLMTVTPYDRTVVRIRARNRALWRYAGLKRLECISDLVNLVEGELRVRDDNVSTTN